MNIAAALTTATEKLHAAGIAEPRREASSLLEFVLRQNSAYLIAHSDDQLAANQKMIFDACVRRRAKREPLQYITGRTEFWRLEFELTPDVLIPRPETEILVEAAILFLQSSDNPRFCEIGVGSGCIAVSILHSLQNATAVASDVSPAALQIAACNAVKHGVDERLDLREADLFEGIDERFDLIVSNPPYVPDDDIDGLQPDVRDFEPRSALAGGADGLDIVRLIVEDSSQFLCPGGVLLVEIGHDQAKRVAKFFGKDVWQEVEFLRDLQNIDRVGRASLK
ncbi:MAG: peptide chain release factor N(5)-glutamine methyltransferase [Pyrinomonadaceae bacterium]